MRKVGKYCRAGQTTDDNMAHAHCMLGTSGYRHTVRICNTYWFSTVTMVARTRLNVTLHVDCVSCWIIMLHRKSMFMSINSMESFVNLMSK